MNDLPQDILKTAGEVLAVYGIKSTPANTMPLARALHAERERCARIAEGELRNVGLVLSNPPKSSAAWDIRNAILKPAK